MGTNFCGLAPGTGFHASVLDKFSGPICKGGKEDMGLGLVMVRRLAMEFGGVLQLGNNSAGGWVQLVLKVNVLEPKNPVQLQCN